MEPEAPEPIVTPDSSTTHSHTSTRASHTVRRPSRQPYLSLFLVILFVVSNLVIGLVGGVAGFVMMSRSNVSGIQKIRDLLHIDSQDGVTIPVKQSVRLEESSAVIDAASKVSPAVVSIMASQKVQDYFGQVSTQDTSGGSGFILTSTGLIVTNKHVVSEQADYRVILNDGRIFPATVQATDPLNDLAIVKIDAKDLPTVELGSSDTLKIGQSVIAVGNALGEFNNSVTYGVVSAEGRSINAGDSGSSSGSTSERLTDLIQTDAAINPGNSGGPLVNLAGQVVGINTAIATTTGGSVGIGFAIPIDSVRKVIDSVRTTGQIIRPYLGVRYVQVTKELQQIDNLSVSYGALVSRGQSGEPAVLSGSPAEKAGIKEGDIILEVNGEQVNENNSLPKRLSNYSVGDKVQIKFLRDGKETTVTVTLERMAS